MSNTVNFLGGWVLVLASFAVGAAVGLGFHREDFLGGYASHRRRLLRLAHVALAALGMLNILYGLSPAPAASPEAPDVAGLLLLTGAVVMPAVCLLTAWKPPFRHLFFVPVSLLVIAVILIIIRGAP